MIQDHMPDNMLKALQKVMSQNHVSRSSSIKYEPLGETIDSPVVLRENPNEGTAIDNNFKDTKNSIENNSFESRTDSANSTTLIIVDVEVHERKETQPGSN